MTPNDPRETLGRRVPDDEWFDRQGDGRIEPGDYGKQTVMREGEPVVEWFNCTPDGEVGFLAVNQPDSSGNYHVVTEHEDGSISVGGSILGRVFESSQVSGAGPISSRGGWHGWLERGVWREA